MKPGRRKPTQREESLFAATQNGEHVPLAARMRPRELDEVVGQDHLVGPGAPLRKLIEADALVSMILQGPPGSGKSTIARIIANKTRSHFELLSAVTAGVADITRIAAEARERRQLYDRGTILFMDELHRLNKAQQDYLLPYVEEGVFVLIGATTENPYYSVTGPLRSRCRLFVLRPLDEEHILCLLQRAIADSERGLGNLAVHATEDALRLLAAQAGGDARVALNVLETAALLAPAEQGGRKITTETVHQALERPMPSYDRAADEHYDTISAYIKSIRGSDPDAAIYWLAKMLEGGEDPRFIARRMVIAAAEDIGLADPRALTLAVAAAQAVDLVGLPECQIPLAEATIYLACAPKSNSAYRAIAAAREEIQRHGSAPVPAHLAGGVRPDDRRGEYLYPHDYPYGWVAQQYLPEALTGRRFWQPKDNMVERKLVEELLRRQGQAQSSGVEGGEANGG
ncbi:MAG: replication-associated recombination protein A [Armatimonadetes bacterium]|nr:replication-associated recombination protein A [Armatimonadota bacterium]